MKRGFLVLLILGAVALGFCDAPDLWPVDGPISSPFGPRESGYGGQAGFHRGIDIAVVEGTPIRATIAGVVIEHWPPPDGYYAGHPVYGGLIVIMSEGYVTLYAHLSRSFVREGMRIEKGQVIGLVGSTGYSTGPHLHYEVWVDPLVFLGEGN